MIRRAARRDRPWMPRPAGGARGRRPCRRASPTLAVAGRIHRFLAATPRPRRFAEIAIAPGLETVPRSDLWAELRRLVDAGAIRSATIAEGRTRMGFKVGRVLPLFWHPRWSFPHLTPDGGEGAPRV